MRTVLVSFSALIMIFLSACSDAPVGSKSRPFTMYFVPSVDAETITRTAEDLSQYVSKEVSKRLYDKEEGFYVKSSVPTSYVAVVEAFGTKKADFAALTTFSYILAKDIKKYDVEALLAVLRGDGEKVYKAQIIAHKNSGIKKLEDIQGKKFAFTDPASTSGYILPAKLLKEKGITPSETIFAQKHDNVVTMIYQRQVDAGATYYNDPIETVENGKKTLKYRDARSRVMTQFPDVLDKVRIIGFTENVPNEPWVVRSILDPKDPARNTFIKTAIRDALISYSKTEGGKKNLEKMYTITGLAPTDDQDYEGIRHTVAGFNVDLEAIMRQEAAKKK